MNNNTFNSSKNALLKEKKNRFGKRKKNCIN